MFVIIYHTLITPPHQHYHNMFFLQLATKIKRQKNVITSHSMS